MRIKWTKRVQLVAGNTARRQNRRDVWATDRQRHNAEPDTLNHMREAGDIDQRL
jgi:hypothetical protein